MTFSYDYIQLDGRAMISFSRTDAMPPVTSLPDVSAFAWSRASDVRVVATDQPGGAGVATVYAAADDGHQCFDHWPAPCTPVTGPLHLGDGFHRITYWSVDGIGNVERPQEIERGDRHDATGARAERPAAVIDLEQPRRGRALHLLERRRLVHLARSSPATRSRSSSPVKAPTWP